MDIIQAVKERRSINFFDPNKKVPEETLTQLLELANLSPSSMNLQPWEVVIVNDPERKSILKLCAFNQPKVVEASAVLIIIANPNTIEKNIDRVINSWLELGYISPNDEKTYRKLPKNLYEGNNRIYFAIKNTAFFAMSIMLAAKGLGLETHPMDGFSEQEVKLNFNIPNDCIIPLLICVGYPSPTLELLPRAFRRDVTEFAKYNIY